MLFEVGDACMLARTNLDLNMVDYSANKDGEPVVIPVDGGGLEFGVWPFDDERNARFVNNALYILKAKPDGCNVSATTRGPNALDNARKRARKEGTSAPLALPSVEFVFGTTTRLYSPEREPNSTTAAGTKWRVRTMQRGGWAWRWYGPGKTLKRRVWIAPFPKGPPGAPLSIHATRLDR